MHPEASRILTTLNSWVNTNEVLTLLVVATISGVAGWLFRVTRRGRRFGWSVLYDEPINQGDPSAKASAPSKDMLSPDMWEIVYQEGDKSKPPHPVTNGSLVVLEMRNIGWQPIRETDFDQQKDFTLRFPGRKVVHFKVRDNARYRALVHRDGAAAPKPGEGDSFTLPALQMNHNDGFKADALPFFPDVGAIPVNGYEPTRGNALDGHYTFLATEYLYTNGIPSGLVADLISFLASQPVIDQLRDTSYIACADLGGSKLDGACSRS